MKEERIDLKVLDAYVNSDTRFCKEEHVNGDLIIYGYDGRKSSKVYLIKKMIK